MESIDMFSTPNRNPKKHQSPTTAQQILIRTEHTKTLTPSSVKRKNGPFHIFNTICNTPPSRFPRIVNPFEAALADRLHLPLICR